MTSVSYNNGELAIGLNKKVMFVNPYDKQIFKDLVLPEKLEIQDENQSGNNDKGELGGPSKLGENQIVEKGEEGGDKKTTPPKLEEKQLVEKEKQDDKQDGPPKLEPLTVQHIKISPDSELLAITTVGQKSLLLYKLWPVRAKLLSVRCAPRACSVLAFSPDSKQLLVCDKTGDCYLYDCVETSAPGKLIFGHLSIVFGAVFSPNQKFIITCDRDEKIRVTNFPDCYDIECYCLGHKEFVSAISLLPTRADEILVSLSGDETMKLWEYQNGKEIGSIKLEAPGIKFSIRKVSEKICHAAVVCYQSRECISLYEIAEDDENLFKLEILRSLYIGGYINNLCYVGEELFLSGIDKGNLIVDIIGFDCTERPRDWKKMVLDYFKDDGIPDSEDVSSWFKKKYDNLSEYYERKRQRLR